MIENVVFKNGYNEIRVNKWDSLTELISKLNTTISLSYRGEETLKYQLKSTFHRQYTTKFLQNDSDILSKHLNNFKNEIRGRIEMLDKYYASDDEMWAIGQHHGLATPLLDWTYSAYVALYFAFYKKTSLDDAVLYVLNLDAIEHDLLTEIQKHTRMLSNTIKNDLDSISSINYIVNGKPSYAQTILDIYNKKLTAPLETDSFCIDVVSTVLNKCIKTVFPKSGENKRLINQRGLFTLTKSLDKMDSLIKQRFRDTSSQVLMKIKIDASLQKEILHQLHAMNINHSTLFPDLGGAAFFCNYKLFDTTRTESSSIELPKVKHKYALKDIKLLTDRVYVDIEDALEWNFYKNVSLDRKVEFISKDLEGISNGEYLYGLYSIFRSILSDFPFEKLESYHHSILYSLILHTKDLFLDNIKDSVRIKEVEESFLNMYCAFTERKSIRYTYNEQNDEFKYDDDPPNASDISFKEWEEAWEDFIEYLIDNILLDDDFLIYPHFTNFHQQPYTPTESEYRKAYEWFKNIYSE